jgi:hypothetical protein
LANHPSLAGFPFEIRKLYLQVEEILTEGGEPDGEPLFKLVAAAVLKNPLAGTRGAAVDALIAASPPLGRLLGERLVGALGGRAVQSYGKAVIVGTDGQHEHGQALVTTAFANPLRELVSGGKAWISSTLKRGPAGTAIDVPLAHKDALYVRANYDTVEVRVPDAPLEDEIVVIVVAASRGRLHARCGGLLAADVKGEDGLH